MDTHIPPESRQKCPKKGVCVSFNSRARAHAAPERRFVPGKLLINSAGLCLKEQIKAIPDTTTIIIIIIIQQLQVWSARATRLISLAAISESQLVLLPQVTHGIIKLGAHK